MILGQRVAKASQGAEAEGDGEDSRRVRPPPAHQTLHLGSFDDIVLLESHAGIALGKVFCLNRRRAQKDG